ncbi:DUF1852 domain-containing protein [Gilvimarinus agarilyticus]|uniref:putative oxygenase MesX n=1 Tax=Gilvimarinus sp. 2_MG-2023 TaxID=3062666 RepID=UPI001C086697|nr:putative oxygenase MesX [Gilvimarinus sp. 2_MG-2023]MBU2887884.1 DUF1852 domain-containing protein [Gilvimarinus agarilyticus]MDO6572522.1 DUF1852 family protein [Gilvimarinus sp. 2_MG-2023]
MNHNLTFAIKRICFDENYQPADSTRVTTNFANLARGEHRRQNLRNALKMIDNSFNALAHWDNPNGDRYSIDLEIISVDMKVESENRSFPSIEILKTIINDHKENIRTEGIVGNNFSSYVRDYDFSIVLQNHNKGQDKFTIPENFGDLHGSIFKQFINSEAYNSNFSKPPVVCLSVSDKKTYHRTENHHPVLGFEYQPTESSLTERYFRKMGLQVRYFMPPNSVAPLAFYFVNDLLNQYTNLELIGTISTMETFQKIYRPEIYNANAVAGKLYQPNLNNVDHSLTKIQYDREERSRLAIKQAKFAEEYFINPFNSALKNLTDNHTL